jgi:hypothetical protein
MADSRRARSAGALACGAAVSGAAWVQRQMCGEEQQFIELPKMDESAINYCLITVYEK